MLSNHIELIALSQSQRPKISKRQTRNSLIQHTPPFIDAIDQNLLMKDLREREMRSFTVNLYKSIHDEIIMSLELCRG